MLKNINKTFKLLGFFAIASGLLSACSATDGGPARIPFCEVNAPLMSMEQPSGQTKLSVDPQGKLGTPDNKVTLAEGVYKYQKGEFFYFDHDRNVSLQLAHSKNVEGKDIFEPECISGNMGKAMQPFSASIEIISDMKINADGTALVSKKRISFLIDPNMPEDACDTAKGHVCYTIADTETDTKISLAKLYDDMSADYPSIDQAVFDQKGGNIQARARIATTAQEKDKKGKTVPTKDGIEQWTNTILKLADPNAADKTKPADNKK